MSGWRKREKERKPVHAWISVNLKLVSEKAVFALDSSDADDDDGRHHTLFFLALVLVSRDPHSLTLSFLPHSFSGRQSRILIMICRQLLLIPCTGTDTHTCEAVVAPKPLST